MAHNIFSFGNGVRGARLPIKNPLDTIYWTRFIVAIIAAIVNSILGQTDLSGIILGIGFYFISYLFIRYILKIGPEEVGSSSTLYSKGVGTYFFTWVTLWAILNNFLYVSAS